LLDIDLDGSRFLASVLFENVKSEVNSVLDSSLKSLIETFEESRTAGKNNFVIKASSGIDGATLNGIIDTLIKRSSPLWVEELRMEEHLRP
jgi:hypothetical protein